MQKGQIKTVTAGRHAYAECIDTKSNAQYPPNQLLTKPLQQYLASAAPNTIAATTKELQTTTLQRYVTFT